MILSLPQIKSIIINNPGKERMVKGCEYSKKLRRHIYGEGLENHIKTVKGFEKDQLKDLRKEYTKSNKDLFSRLGRPIDKVFSARGGSIYYNLAEDQDKRARILSQNIRNGYSTRKWVETFWKPHMLDDPFGIVFMEMLPQQDAVLAAQQGKSFVYPTYKSISSIYDYLPKGNKLEYIVFKVTNAEKKAEGLKEDQQVFRVVDDSKDYYVERVGEEVRVIDNLTLPNFFGEVPGMINSDIVNPDQENCFLSFYDDIVELADDYLLDGSIKRIHKFRHGFPKYGEFADDCTKCGGSKYEGSDICPACKGTGKNAMVNVHDIKLLAWPAKDEHLVLPKDAGGYIEPSEIFHKISTEDILSLENTMTFTLWGTQSKLKAQGPTGGPSGEPETATQILDDIKPQSDRLVPLSEMAEARHKFILDAVIRLNLMLASYQGSSVNYGRRYMLESPDAIWLKYSEARTKGSPQSVLDTLLNEYYEANYQSDPIGLAMAKKLMYVEPFVHFDVAKLQALNPDPKDYACKLYFSEWLSTMNEAMILSMSVELLKENLQTYAGTKQLKEDVEKPLAA
jgi:hypothetical protein